MHAVIVFFGEHWTHHLNFNSLHRGQDRNNNTQNKDKSIEKAYENYKRIPFLREMTKGAHNTKNLAVLAASQAAHQQHAAPKDLPQDANPNTQPLRMISSSNSAETKNPIASLPISGPVKNTAVATTNITSESSKSSLKRKHEEMDPEQAFVKAILPNIPLIMYGAGDVHPDKIDPASAELVAILTAQYVKKLTAAAVDAHDILTDGNGGKLPPEPYQDYKKKQVDPSNWDEEQPKPLIRNQENKAQSAVKDDEDDSSDDLKQKPKECFVKGVDIYPNRIREPHSTIPSTIGLQSFAFPLCNDAEVYAKIMKMKQVKKNIDEALIDSSIMEFIKGEEVKGDDSEEEYQHLSDAVYRWVNSAKESALSAGGTIAEVADATAKANTRDEARRKEMARKLVGRTKVSIGIPGLEEFLSPMISCLKWATEEENIPIPQDVGKK